MLYLYIFNKVVVRMYLLLYTLLASLQKNIHASSSPPILEDGELPPHVGCEKEEGVVPEFRPGKAGNDVSIEEGKIVSVFVDNIPAGHKVSWLRKSFSTFGRIVDSYIPGHKSRATNMLYGFVRFVGSAAAFSAISNMNEFWVGNHQLIVREARFSKFSGLGRRNKTPAVNFQILNPSSKSGPFQGKENFFPTGIKSYAQVLSGASLGGGSGDEPIKKLNICGVESSLGWLENSVIALASGMFNFDELSAHLFKTMKGLQKICKWGGRKLILQFYSKVEATQMLGCNIWSAYLSELSLWKGELVNRVRLVWLSCESLPLSVWNLESFKLIAGLWGNLVAVDDDTYNATDFFKARLLIKTEAVEVGGDITVSAGDLRFVVVVKVEGGGSALGGWPEYKAVQSKPFSDGQCKAQGSMELSSAGVPELKPAMATKAVIIGASPKDIFAGKSLRVAGGDSSSIGLLGCSKPVDFSSRKASGGQLAALQATESNIKCAVSKRGGAFTGVEYITESSSFVGDNCEGFDPNFEPPIFSSRGIFPSAFVDESAFMEGGGGLGLGAHQSGCDDGEGEDSSGPLKHTDHDSNFLKLGIKPIFNHNVSQNITGTAIINDGPDVNEQTNGKTIIVDDIVSRMAEAEYNTPRIAYVIFSGPKLGSSVGDLGLKASFISGQDERLSEFEASTIRDDCVGVDGSDASGPRPISPVCKDFKAFDPGPFQNLMSRRPIAGKSGPKWSLNLNNKINRKARKEVRARQCLVPVAGIPSNTAEINNTKMVADLIGVSFAGIGDNCIRNAILEEKAEIR